VKRNFKGNFNDIKRLFGENGLFYFAIRPPTPLKGGSFTVFKKNLFMFEDVPPFRGQGGKKAGLCK
jgi:hypothetical protein